MIIYVIKNDKYSNDGKIQHLINTETTSIVPINPLDMTQFSHPADPVVKSFAVYQISIHFINK